MEYFVYILRSGFDGSYYIGYTTDVARRLSYHNGGRGRYTRKKLPWELVYQETFLTKREALQRERFLKSMKSRVYLEGLINGDATE